MGFHFLLQDLPDPGIEPASPALHVDSLPIEPPGMLGRNNLIQRLPSYLQCLRKSCLGLRGMPSNTQSIRHAGETEHEPSFKKRKRKHKGVRRRVSLQV